MIFEGYIPPEKVAQLVAQLDVGLCPYMKNPGQDACSPMRLLVYTAAGIPVVCTDLEEVHRMQLPNVVLVTEDSAALAEGIRKALTLPRQRPQEIYEYEVGHLVEAYENILLEVARQPSRGGVFSNK